MVGVGQKLVKLVLAVGGRKNVGLAAHFFLAQPRLEKPAGRAAVKIYADQRIKPEHRERLLRQKNPAARLPLHLRQNGKIPREPRLVHDIRRRRRFRPDAGHTRRRIVQPNDSDAFVFIHTRSPIKSEV